MLPLSDEVERKLFWERRFARGFAPVSRRIVAEFRASISDGVPWIVEEYDEPIAAFLGTHYNAVGSEFALTVETGVDYALVATALAALFSEHSRRTAPLITGTTARDATRARELAESSPDIAPLIGAARRHAVAAVAPALLARTMAARTTVIATTETQFAAEASKAETARISAGADARLVRKVWQTVGDERVRVAHRDAEGQSVPVDEAFEVGGERLMYPRDTALGATPGNVINCRCSVWYDEQTIRAIREGNR